MMFKYFGSVFHQRRAAVLSEPRVQLPEQPQGRRRQSVQSHFNPRRSHSADSADTQNTRRHNTQPYPIMIHKHNYYLLSKAAPFISLNLPICIISFMSTRWKASLTFLILPYQVRYLHKCFSRFINKIFIC